jgi:hypothetical protein
MQMHFIECKQTLAKGHAERLQAALLRKDTR